MKKIVSLLLSIAMLIGVLSASVNTYAAGWASYAKSIEVNTTYTEFASKSDYCSNSPYKCYDSFLFRIPINGKIELYLESESRIYFDDDTYYYIYSANNLDDYIFANDFEYNYRYSSGRNVYYGSHTIYLPEGTYYFVAEYDRYDVNDNYYDGKYSFNLKYSPSITKPSYLTATSRSTSSIGLEWGKVGDITGYQVYRNTKSGWKWVADTTKNYYTVTGLKPGVKYDLRVRAYVRADGKNYYSGWRNLATPTKPATVSIKTPSTNSKHQIIAKWSTVADGTGYQVQYSKSKSFSSIIASKYVSGITKTSYTGKNFTKGKTYYVRVRAYKTVDGTKYHGAWSKTKSIKCK